MVGVGSEVLYTPTPIGIYVPRGTIVHIYLQTISISCIYLLLFLIKNNYTIIFHLYRFIEMYYKDLLLIISKNIYYVLKHKIFFSRKFGYIISFFILQYCWCDCIKKYLHIFVVCYLD